MFVNVMCGVCDVSWSIRVEEAGNEGLHEAIVMAPSEVVGFAGCVQTNFTI